jgi:hypothetical protein
MGSFLAHILLPKAFLTIYAAAVLREHVGAADGTNAPPLNSSQYGRRENPRFHLLAQGALYVGAPTKRPSQGNKATAIK